MSPQICVGWRGRGQRRAEPAGERWTRTYLDRCLELEQDGLGNEDLASLSAQVSNLGLEQLDLLAGAAATDLQEAVDYGVQVDIVVICHGDYVGRQGLAWWWQRGEEGWTRRRGVGCAVVGQGFTQSDWWGGLMHFCRLEGRCRVRTRHSDAGASVTGTCAQGQRRKQRQSGVYGEG